MDHQHRPLENRFDHSSGIYKGMSLHPGRRIQALQVSDQGFCSKFNLPILGHTKSAKVSSNIQVGSECLLEVTYIGLPVALHLDTHPFDPTLDRTWLPWQSEFI